MRIESMNPIYRRTNFPTKVVYIGHFQQEYVDAESVIESEWGAVAIAGGTIDKTTISYVPSING